MEFADEVNERDEVVGRAPLDGLHARKALHRAVHIFVFNSEGKLFVQQCACSKGQWAGQWTSSVAGHVSSGEAYEDAALREMEEEIGAKDVKLVPVLKKMVSLDGINEIVRLFECEYNGGIKINRKELSDGKFFSIEEVKRLVAGDTATSFFRELFKEYLKAKKCR